MKKTKQLWYKKTEKLSNVVDVLKNFIGKKVLSEKKTTAPSSVGKPQIRNVQIVTKLFTGLKQDLEKETIAIRSVRIIMNIKMELKIKTISLLKQENLELRKYKKIMLKEILGDILVKEVTL